MSPADANRTFEALLSRLHDGIVRSDIETVMGCFHPTACIADSLEGGLVTGLDEIRAYYLRQFAIVRVDAALLSVLHLDVQTADTLVQVMVRGADGGFWWEGQVRVAYQLSDGLIASIAVSETPDQA